MWIFLSVVVFCVFVFAMALLYVRVQDVRADATTRQVEADRQYDKYVRVTRQEALTELTAAIQAISGKQELESRHKPLPSQMSDRDLDMQKEINRHARQIPVARYINPKEPPMLNSEWVEYEKQRQYDAWRRQNG